MAMPQCPVRVPVRVPERVESSSDICVLLFWQGRLLAGVGSALRVYEAGRKKLLRKCEHRKLPTHIATLASAGDRIYVGDLQVRGRSCLVNLVLALAITLQSRWTHKLAQLAT